MQKKATKVKKYSIKEAEELSSSIRALSRQTEEELCKSLNYNEGYISQLRSRELATGQPQVSEKFLQQLKHRLAGLQNARSPDVNLEMILRALTRLENGQAYIRAEVRGWGQYGILKSNGWNQEDFLQEWVKVGKLIGANIQVDAGQGNSGTGS